MKIKYKVSLVTLCLLILLGMLYVQMPSQPLPSEICCNSHCFRVELAQTPTERQMGLMHRTYLPEDTGMLFIFDVEQIHSFWMKNTHIPLDILRINSSLQIVDIQAAQPCESDPCPSYIPSAPAQYVLEINQGRTTDNAIKIGHQCFLSLSS